MLIPVDAEEQEHFARGAVMRELRSLGSEKTVATLRRHGASGEVLGVSYADFGKLAKKYKADQPLAEALWATGVHDARVLATMAADPARVAERTLDGWAADCPNHILADAVGGVAARSPFAKALMRRWIASPGEWVGRAGWCVLAHLALGKYGTGHVLDDAALAKQIPVIERGIHKAKNYVRAGMNNALIAIGLRSDALRDQALAAAARIGKVDVDRGDTACKTPDAAAYIRKAAGRKK